MRRLLFKDTKDRSLKFIIIFLFTIMFSCCAQASLFDFTKKSSEPVLETLSGKKIPFSSLSGHWVLINYWASWCQPCVEEIAVFNQLHKQKPKIYIFAVNYDAMQLSKQKRLTKQFHIHYPSLKHSVAKELHLGAISVVPVTFVFNPQGKLHTILYGGQTLESIREEIS